MSRCSWIGPPVGPDINPGVAAPREELVVATVFPTIPMPLQPDWIQSVLFDRGYLARIKGEAIKVYLVLVEAGGGQPDRSVRMSLNQLMGRTQLTCPTVQEALANLERLGLVVSTTREPGRAKTYYISDPPPASSR